MRAPKHPHPTPPRKRGRGVWGRLVLAAIVVATGPVLSACDSLDTFDVFDSKKKLAGERKPVFPEGVPGVAAGVPPELVKGYREPEGGGLDPAKAAAEESQVGTKAGTQAGGAAHSEQACAEAAGAVRSLWGGPDARGCSRARPACPSGGDRAVAGGAATSRVAGSAGAVAPGQ